VDFLPPVTTREELRKIFVMIYVKFLSIAFGILNLQVLFVYAEEGILNVLDEKRQLSKSEKLFKAGFLEARLQHIEAIKHIRKTMDYEKQYKLTNQVFQKLFDILKKTKVILESSDYVPALNFPSNQTIIEALGQVLDNTALYGEFQLKLPDITDRIMKSHNEWMVLIKWAIGFSNSTGLYDAKTTVMLNLVCQEMNLIERTENFINPYRSKSNPKVPISKPKETSSKKKVFKKGPRMSRNFHTEL